MQSVDEERAARGELAIDTTLEGKYATLDFELLRDLFPQGNGVDSEDIKHALISEGPQAISETFERLLYLDSTVYKVVRRAQARWRAKVAQADFRRMLQEKRDMEALMEAMRASASRSFPSACRRRAMQRGCRAQAIYRASAPSTCAPQG